MSQGKQVAHHILDQVRRKVTGDAYMDITHPGNWPNGAEWGCVVASFCKGTKGDLPPGDLNYFPNEGEYKAFIENLTKEAVMTGRAAIVFVYEWDLGPNYRDVLEVNCD